MEIFKFDHIEGTEILAADNAKEAVMYYFTQYQDDLNTEDMIEDGGIKIEELQGDFITKKHEFFNEEINDMEKTSYKELAEKYYHGKPTILVTSDY